MALAPISAQSKEYLKVPVSARNSLGVIDPTTGTAQFAFLVPENTPAAGTTWTNGTWETSTPSNAVGIVYKARCLIGPGGDITLTAGSYDVWLKVTYLTEAVIRKAGTIRII
jgi:hypothetical protein